MVRIHLIHWKIKEHPETIQLLQDLGYEVEADLPQSNTFFKDLRANPPDIMVIDLSRLPSQGRDMAINLRAHKTTEQVPIIFVDGAEDKVASVRKVVPDAIYTTWAEIAQAVRQAQENPPDAQARDSVFAAFAGTPLVKKLGIQQGDTLALLEAPQDIENILVDLPAGVKLERQLSPQTNLILWFVGEPAQLADGLPAITTHCQQHNTRLWICWPKQSSGVKTSVTQNLVRKSGLEIGLVDYKICSMDKTWSALLFTWRG